MNKMINDMDTFSKTYYTDKLNITIRIKRDELCTMGCRLTIKDRTRRDIWRNFDRIVYTWFYNDKKMFKNYRDELVKVRLPRNQIKEIIDDVKTNLMYKKVVTYEPIDKKMIWD